MIYDREVPFELRVQESSEGPQPVGTLEAIKVKLLVLGDLAAASVERDDAGDVAMCYTEEMEDMMEKT